MRSARATCFYSSLPVGHLHQLRAARIVLQLRDYGLSQHRHRYDMSATDRSAGKGLNSWGSVTGPGGSGKSTVRLTSTRFKSRQRNFPSEHAPKLPVGIGSKWSCSIVELKECPQCPLKHRNNRLILVGAPGFDNHEVPGRTMCQNYSLVPVRFGIAFALCDLPSMSTVTL